MPHIKQEDRLKYKKLCLEIIRYRIETKGDLEYLIYCLLGQYMVSRDTNYTNLHDAVYAAIHAGEEFKRLHLDRREDVAKGLNGEAFYEDKI